MTMTTKFIRFTEKARAEPTIRFNALMGLLFEPEGLHASFERQSGSKAPGVDGIRKVDYAEGLESRLTELSRSLRQMGYRPQPVRSVRLSAKSQRSRTAVLSDWLGLMKNVPG